MIKSNKTDHLHLNPNTTSWLSPKSSPKMYKRISDMQPQHILYKHKKNTKEQDLLRQRRINQKCLENKILKQNDPNYWKTMVYQQAIWKVRKAFQNQESRTQKELDQQQQIIQQEWIKALENRKTFKYFFLDNLRQGHPRYSPYKMFDHSKVSKPALSFRPDFKHDLYAQKLSNIHSDNLLKVPQVNILKADQADDLDNRKKSESKCLTRTPKNSKIGSIKDNRFGSPTKRNQLSTTSRSFVSNSPVPCKNEIKTKLKNRSPLVQEFVNSLAKNL